MHASDVKGTEQVKYVLYGSVAYLVPTIFSAHEDTFDYMYNSIGHVYKSGTQYHSCISSQNRQREARTYTGVTINYVYAYFHCIVYCRIERHSIYAKHIKRGCNYRGRSLPTDPGHPWYKVYVTSVTIKLAV